MTYSIRLYDRAFLSKESGFVERCNSHAVPVEGNSVRVNATLINSSGNGEQLVLQLEGTYDGQVWLTNNLTNAAISFGPNPTTPNVSQSTSLVTLDYAFVRLRATVSQSVGSDAKALFDAEVVFSNQ